MMIENIVKIAQDINQDTRLRELIDRYSDKAQVIADTLSNNAALASDFVDNPLSIYRGTEDKRWLLEALTRSTKGGFAESLLKFLGGATIDLPRPYPWNRESAGSSTNWLMPASSSMSTSRRNKFPLFEISWK